MSTENAARVAQWRANHPERAQLVAAQNRARDAAYRRLACLHSAEAEALVQAECDARGIPRYLPPLAPEDDRRSIRGRES